jgi:small subunit ribosomal protein S3
LLLEDRKIRKYIGKRFRRPNSPQRPGISKVRIERTREKVTIYIHSSRVGAIIGKKGETIDKLTSELENLTRRKVEVKTIEVMRPETDAQLVAEDIAEQLEKRQSFRRTLKKALEIGMEGGAKGVKVQMSGRLGGSEMARVETGMLGSIPLSTLRARVEYGFTEASTPQGNIGIKVWVNNGDYLNPETVVDSAPPLNRGRRRGNRG